MKHNNAVGVKGKSGRKGGTDEHIRNLVVNKSWDRLLKKFDKEEDNSKRKIIDKELEKQLDYIAIEIAKKTIPQNIDLTTKGEKLNNYSDEQLKLIAQRILNDSGTES